MSDEREGYAYNMPDVQREQWMWLLKQGAETSFRETVEWAREVTKHLVILNGAGLAATASIIAANVIPAEYFGTLSWVTGLYIAGLICAFINMVWRWQVSGIEAEGQFNFIHDFALDRASIQHSDAPFLNRILVRGVTYIVLAIASISFGGGSCLLVRTLLVSREASETDRVGTIAYRFVMPVGVSQASEYPGILKPLTLRAAP